MKTTYFNYLFLFVALFLFACKAKQIASETETIKFDETTNTGSNNNPEIVDLDTLETTLTEMDTAVIDSSLLDVENKKSIYKVAVVLPFMEDSVRSAWNNAKVKNFQEFKTAAESELAISFTEGMLMALKDLQLDAKFELTFYDDNNDDSKIDGILKKIKESDVDIIIGSYNKENVVKLANLAKEKKLIHLSPFNPSKSASAGNPRYYMFEPSLEQHLLTMIHFGLDSIEDPHFKFIYHNNPVSVFYASYLSEYIEHLNDSLDAEDKINFALIQTPTSSIKIDNCLDEGANNVLIVNSFNETFVLTFLKQLNDKGKNSNFIAFGMPGWENSQIVRLEYISSEQIHFTKSSWIDNEDPKVKTLNNAYETKYGAKPKQGVFLGYDLTSFLFKTINKYGLNFNKFILNEPYIGLDRVFSFEKIMNADKKVNRIENTNLRIYKIEDFEPILVK